MSIISINFHRFQCNKIHLHFSPLLHHKRRKLLVAIFAFLRLPGSLFLYIVRDHIGVISVDREIICVIALHSVCGFNTQCRSDPRLASPRLPVKKIEWVDWFDWQSRGKLTTLIGVTGSVWCSQQWQACCGFPTKTILTASIRMPFGLKHTYAPRPCQIPNLSVN